MQYKFYLSNEKARTPVPDDIVVLYMKYTTENDSVLFDTKEMQGQPFRMKVKPRSKNGGTIDDAFAMMHEGDSARFIVDAERFFLETKGTEVPTYIKPKSKLIFDIKLVEIFSYDKFLENQKNSQVVNAESEKSMLEIYLKNSNITAKPEASGLYYIEYVAGKGNFPEKGQKVTVHYTGSFLSGEVFDSSLERGETFTFEFGADEVIQGMEEGIGKMKSGGKAILIIPSNLAYGSQQYKMIPPFSTLVFEIELININ
jgi:FKBP-type peptidyl-prolyl cis-trans isomerase